MQSRVFTRLSKWAVMEEDQLEQELTDLTGQPPTLRMRQNARRLFTEALEDSPGLRIQTIHSFCQSVLARFPLEAGVPPNFQVLDERTASEMLEEARLRLLAGQEEPGIDEAGLTDALDHLIGESPEASFSELLRAIIQQRRRFARVLAQPGGLSAAQEQLYNYFRVPPGATTQDMRVCYGFRLPDDKRNLQTLVQAMLSGQKNDIKYAERMLPFMESDFADYQKLDDYIDAFLTIPGEIRKNLPTKQVQEAHPLLMDIWQEEARRCSNYRAALRALENARLSVHTLTLAAALFTQYERMKRLRGVLDYDDLILHTRQLLCEGGHGSLDWVLYKLDGGIDHLLVDEAQDTSAEQWAITQRLVEEFYAGLGAREVERTLFVVGDGKQSIYRFQGAEPEDFHRMRLSLGQQADHSRHLWREVKLEVSFRSVQAVLDVVDATFSLPDIRLRSMEEEETIHHHAHRLDQPGCVELWPLTGGSDETPDEPWSLPTEERMHGTATHRLAQTIARTIRRWLTEGRLIEATQKPIRAGDILILLRQRSELAAAIANALRQAQVPVAGLDRMQLTKALAVRDLMALGHFLLLPQSDLVLACVLKSPFYNISEESLFALCYGRGTQPLWERLMEYRGNDPYLLAARDELTKLHVDHVIKGCSSPYEFYTELLYARDAMKRFIARMGEGVRELLEVFLEQARTYEMTHPPSLQGFLHWLEQGEADIKRDMEQGADEVRIMTVHGAKGLEAPIVFMPDTTSRPHGRGISFVVDPVGPDESEVLIRLPSSKESDTYHTTQLKAKKASEDEEEYFRLLYVAMTRARDELYICGVASERAGENCWYNVVRRGMETMEGISRLSRPEHGEEKVLSYTSGHTPAAEKKRDIAVPLLSLPLPGHVYTEPASEAPRQRMLQPSRLMDEQEAALSPTESLGFSDDEDMSAAERGTLLHRLLHILSVVAPIRRNAVATEYLERYRFQLSPEKREAMMRNLLLLMADPIYAPIFSPLALSEVSVSGLLENAAPILGCEGTLALSGQIDRLLVTPERVLIIDFKTGELPLFGAVKGYEIPELYRRQMEAYRQLLQRIYPRHTVECALIYTAVPILLPVPASLTPRRAIAI
jgi:ATP-dependent helicase/nuclease subunit A